MNKKNNINISKNAVKVPILVMLVFSVIATIVSLIFGTEFYLFNFLYIGFALSLSVFLQNILPKEKAHIGRRVSMALVGMYMLGYLGLYLGENMQIEGLWIYLIVGVYSGPVIHYAVAKIIGPLVLGRAWCGWACWSAMLFEFLPYKVAKNKPKKKLVWLRYIHVLLSLAFVIILYTYLVKTQTSLVLHWEIKWLIIGNVSYYLVGIILALIMKDNRAFCKYICPIPVLMKPAARVSFTKMKIDSTKCIDCKKCEKNCPMDVKLLDYKNKGKRITSSKCILCNNCANVCPTNAVKLSFGIGDRIK